MIPAMSGSTPGSAVEHDPARVPVPRMIAALDDAGYDARA